MPIHPCIALGLFLANCAMDMNDTLCPNDPTIHYLSYALQRYQCQSDDQHTSDTLTQKYSDTMEEASSSISTSISITTNPTRIENIGFTVESITPYKHNMLFGENHVDTRKPKRGFKRMDRLACIE
ncbi:hypothetical protein RO3G_14447 [Rhizopus delemar RA 99-880]|uniref:Uncharacterized protein n=1 Tax=Rhizopus delemar (strain RA 99-880 / ATCC MYA-4621 / FGSC 9543 / NRRL 43880) TaxID=246409 RepID=I1CMQ6_RHIO9|nr:hypothetical protein RO3G_14447 [Rhizopus delemar RA 99-880]|eukprot:EIE89736.1 hypothetical protein RO3G_14447 [Rhizopus delemar RA 99-880]